ncbi:MAG: glucose-6-phosphate dehydrogenase, partial [Bacteroidales bacterium]
MQNINTKPEEQILVIFGATGDLGKRKLIPALYALDMLNLLPEKFAILGAGRSAMDDDSFRDTMTEALKSFSKEDNKSGFLSFVNKIYYAKADPKEEDSFSDLAGKLEFIRKQYSFARENIIFYLSTPPALYRVIPERLAAAGLNKEDNGWKRLVI